MEPTRYSSPTLSNVASPAPCTCEQEKTVPGVAEEIRIPLGYMKNFALLSVDLLDELTEILSTNEDRTVAEARKEFEDILDDLRQNVALISKHGQRVDSVVLCMLLQSLGWVN